MGAWGVGQFDNDIACDWVYSLNQVEDLSMVEKTVENVFTTTYVDTITGCEALAAIETIARMNGHWGNRNSYTEQLDQWVEDHAEIVISERLISQCHNAINSILDQSSELKELWAETDCYELWVKEVESLRKRLSAKPIGQKYYNNRLPQQLYKLVELYNKNPQKKIRDNIYQKIMSMENVNDPRNNDTKHMTPLSLMARHGFIEGVQFLLKRGANPNKMGLIGDTPFKYACGYNHLEIAKILYEAGAKVFKWKINLNKFFTRFEKNVGEPIIYKYSPALFFTAAHGTAEGIKYLVTLGGNVNQYSVRTGESLLHFACNTGNYATSKYLIDSNLDVNRKKKTTYETPLHLAARSGNLKLVELLLDNGANPNPRSKRFIFGKDDVEFITPLDYIDPENQANLFQLMRKYGAQTSKELSK